MQPKLVMMVQIHPSVQIKYRGFPEASKNPLRGGELGSDTCIVKHAISRLLKVEMVSSRLVQL